MADGGGDSFHITSESYCVTLPPKMDSKGTEFGYTDGHVIQYAVPQLLLQFIVIFITTRTLTLILRPLRMPNFVSQLLAGVLLGPSGLSGIGKEKVMQKLLFPKLSDKGSHAEELLDAEANLGYTFFLFIIAVKMDTGMILRVGRKSWLIGVAGVLVPLFIGNGAAAILGNGRDKKQLYFIVTEQALASFPVISWLLHDMKLLNTELGRLALSSSIVSNFIGIFFVFVMSIISREQPVDFMRAGLCVAFILVVVFVIRPCLRWVVRNTVEGQPVKDIYVISLLILFFLSALASDLLDQSVFFGPFILGLAVPEGPPLGSAIVSNLETFFEGLLLPVYVTSTAAKINLTSLNSDIWSLKIEVIIILMVFVLKMATSLAPLLYCNLPFTDSLALSLILNCKGVVELGTYLYLSKLELLSESRLNLMVLSILISAIFTPLSVRKLYDSSKNRGGYKRRNVFHHKPDAELPVLACIHRPDNILPLVNLIDSFCPTKEKPIGLYVLHLLKLSGQAAPVFISHNKQKRAEENSLSDTVIIAFTNYANNNPGGVNLNMFTMKSMPKMMEQDVCYLALDKHASLIVLPFHRRWSKDGLVHSEDNAIQALNRAVLDRAPCSVAILVDRGYLGQASARRSSSISIGLLFLGGNDDREALTLSKRMIRDPSFVLTVVHICVEEEGGGVISWDKMMDDEVLSDIKDGRCGDNVRYVREVVEEGPQTALLVRSVAKEFSLMITGRHHGVESTQTSGLSEWMEFPELGVLGDILASPDISTRASVLVVQQQRLNSGPPNG